MSKNKNIPSEKEQIEQIASKGDQSKDADMAPKSNKPISEYGEQYDARDELYTGLLRQYISAFNQKAEAKAKYKAKFFYIIMIVFCVLIGIPLIAILLAVILGSHNASIIVALVCGAISILSSIIILPKIIAQHLFPTDEDKNMIDLVKSMQENDSGIRSNSKKEE